MNFIWSAYYDPISAESTHLLSAPRPGTSYDQWGSLHGSIVVMKGANEEANSLYLRGLREHRLQWWNGPEEDWSIVGVTEHGFNFVLRKQSEKTTGHLLIPGVSVTPITEVDWTGGKLQWLSEVLRRKMLAANEMTIRFKAGSRWFQAVLSAPTSNKLKFYSGRPWSRETLCLNADLTLNCKRGFASIHVTNKFDGICPIGPSSPSQPLLVENKIPKGPIPFVVRLDTNICSNSSVSGGKGSSLALMTLAGWNVPSGVVVTSAAHGMQIRLRQDLKKAIEEVKENANALSVNRKDLEQACTRAQDLFSHTPVSDEVSESIANALDSIYEGTEWCEKIRFAVRSSAIGEDSDDLSAAGQNETFLGCRGKQDIGKAVAKCWASLYAFQSVEYRRQNGQPVCSEMAVVIQEMVDAEAAGVMFSRDPTSGDPSRIVITANFGLGESVVSARSEPDTVIVARSWWNPSSDQLENPPDRYRILERNLGTKKTKVILSEEHTREEEVSPELASRLCIDDEMILDLAKMAVSLETSFGGPRDIEFAVKGENIYLLQSRPITSFFTWTDFELTHEFDTPVASENDIATKANLGEVIPGASTPLTSSSVVKILDLAIQHNMRAKYFQYSPVTSKSLPMSHHHALFNFMDVCLQSIEAMEITKPQVAVDMAVFGHRVTTLHAVETAVERHGIDSKITSAKNLLVLAKDLVHGVYWQKYGIPKYCHQKLFDNFDELKRMEAGHLLKVILESTGNLGQVFWLHSKVSECSTAFQLVLLITLTENSDVSSWDSDLFSDIASLLATDSEHDVESAGVPTGLKDLSSAICGSQSSSKFPTLSQAEAEAFLQQTDVVKDKYREFLDVYGHRCLREFELRSTPWIEDRRPLIKTLQAMVEAEHKRPPTPQKTVESLDDQIQHLKRDIKPGTRKALRFLLPYAHGGVALREKTKSLLIARVHEFRRAVRILADAMRTEGRIPDQKLIFFLTLYEIKELIDTRAPIYIQKAIRRSRLYPEWEKLRFPEMIQGVPKPLSPSTSAVFGVGAQIHGTPVCRGVYRGVARVMTSVAEAETIQQGDVLVTISTDIGWSPYFPLLGGIVTELGGLISHGAVVAREYGLPCVVGAEGATGTFTSGDLVEIDGTKGIITKIEKNQENLSE